MHNGHYFQDIAIVPIVKTIVPIVVKKIILLILSKINARFCQYNAIA